MTQENPEKSGNKLPAKHRYEKVTTQFIPPPKYEHKLHRFPVWQDTPESLELFNQRGVSYFDSCHEQGRPLTMNGLANALGMSTTTLWRYEKKDGFAPILAQFRQWIMEFAESNLYSKSYQGAAIQLSRLQRDIFASEPTALEQLSLSLADAINQANRNKHLPETIDAEIEDVPPDPMTSAMLRANLPEPE